MGMMLVAYIFLVLHAPGGHEITVALNEIVSMREGEGGDKNKVLTGEIRCAIFTEDGKTVNVVETCQVIRDMIKEEVRKLETNRK